MAFRNFCTLVDKEIPFPKYSGKCSFEIIDGILTNNLFGLKYIQDKKCDKISEDYRTSGNLSFNNNDKNVNNIYLIYTKALYNAESEMEKSYAFGNRSGILFKMRLYKPCIKDIDAAIKYNYPENKIYKLLLRKIESLIMLDKFEEAEQVINGTHLKVESNVNGYKHWQQKIKVARNKCLERKKYDTYSSDVVLKQNYPTVTIDMTRNSVIYSFSEKLGLSVCETEGRCILANRDIDIGEVIAVETPYAYRLTTDNMMTHCYYCLQRNINLIPCDNCCRVGFCDEQCQKFANESMRHDLECGMMSDILSTYSKELGLLAYGIVSRTRPEIVKSCLDQMSDTDCRNEAVVIDSNDYRSVLSIETNEHLRTPDDLRQRCLSAVFLALCLVQKLFGNEESSSQKEWLKTFSRVFLKHLQGIPCNAHSLGEHTTPINGSITESFTNYVGNGLYPALSMINHSCAPNVVRVTMSCGLCVLRATTRIASGQQILDNYSAHFATMTKEDRRQLLRDQYQFDCRCVPCEDNWPTFDTQRTMDNRLRFKCPRCPWKMVDDDDSPALMVIDCPRCNWSMEGPIKRLLSLNDNLSANMNRIIDETVDGVEQYLKEFSVLLQDFVQQPNIVFHQTAEMLKLLWTLQGSRVSVLE